MQRQKHRSFPLVSFFCFCLFPFSACSTQAILDQDIAEGTQFDAVSLQRNDKNITYRSNLKNFSLPTEQDLLQEAKIKNRKAYLESLSVLEDWVLDDLSNRKKQKLAQNCLHLVGKYNSEFPLNEKTLACSAWWVSEKNTESKFAKRSSVEPSSQNKSFKNILAQVDVNSTSQANLLVKRAVQNSEHCTNKNETAALFFKLEKLLPDPVASKGINKLYANLQSCLKPNEEPTEKIHLRAGLLYLLQGKPSLAQKALEKTQLESDPQENSRNLFWLGTLYQKNNPKKDNKKNPYWTKLIKEYPVSYAAIVACQQMGIDPIQVLASDEQIPVDNRIAGGWNKPNLEAFVFDILNAAKRKRAANAWATYVARNTQTTNPNLLLYWAMIEHQNKEDFNTIILIGKYTKYEKNFKASPTLLRLQFPYPYLKEILQESDDVDPILMLALIRQESAFSANARSSANARGLMQVLPSTAKHVRRSIRPNDLYNAKINLMIGRIYLERLLKKYDGQVEYVLAAYNAGDMNLDKWRNRVSSKNMILFSDYIPFSETRNYISIILRNYYWYSRLFQEQNDPLTSKALAKSKQARWKSESIDALLSYSKNNQLTTKQKELLNKIYLFGGNASDAEISQTALKD